MRIGPLELGLILLVIFIIPIYFIPTIIVLARHADNRLMVFLINLFLGWSFIGWVVALALSFSKKNGKTQNDQIVIMPEKALGNNINSPAEASSYCTKCGVKLGKHVQYCPKCGTKIEND